MNSIAFWILLKIKKKSFFSFQLKFTLRPLIRGKLHTVNLRTLLSKTAARNTSSAEYVLEPSLKADLREV